VERDNEDQKLIKPEWVRRAEILVEKGDLKERIKKAHKGNEKVMKVVEELKKTEIKTLKNKEWEIEDGIIMKEGRIYVLERELRGEIIQLYYNIPIGEHGER